MKKNGTPVKALMILIILSGLSFSKTMATTYYSAGSGNWNVNGTWSTVGHSSSTNTGTYPRSGDVAIIGNGHTVTIVNTPNTVSSITIGGGTSGILQFGTGGPYTLTVAGSLTLNNGAILRYDNNNNRVHSLFVSGNIVNNGSIDLYRDSNDNVNLTFNSTGNSTVSGSGTWDLHNVYLVKSLTSSYLEVQASGMMSSVNQFILLLGVYHHNTTETYNLVSSSTNLTILPTVGITVSQGTLHLSPSGDEVVLQGILTVNGGTLKIGQAGSDGIRYDRLLLTTPRVYVYGGTLEVLGGITHSSGSSSDPFIYTQSGGDLILGTNSGSNDDVFYINDVSGSQFNMSGGKITLQEPSGGGTSKVDFSICGTLGVINVTGGEVQFGNGSTPAGSEFNFTPFASIQYPHFIVSGPAADAVSLQGSRNNGADCQFLSLRIEANKTFDVRSVASSSGDTRMISLTGTYDGSHAFYNEGTFEARTGTLRLSGTSAQSIFSSAVPSLYNFTVDNPAGVSLEVSLSIANTLQLDNGVVSATTSNRIVLGNNGVSNIGSASSFIDGPMRKTVASASVQSINIPVGRGSAYRPIILNVQHTNSTSVDYDFEVSSTAAEDYGYTLPVGIDRVSYVRSFLVSRSPVANLSSADITLHYDMDDGVSDYANLRVVVDDGAGAWRDLGGAGTANGTGSITSGSISGFSTVFGLANAIPGSNPLPVSWLSFKAGKVDDDVQLEWRTASETNSNYFEIERSNDGLSFKGIGVIEAAGNSNTIQTYSFTDSDPLAGINYYRLRQVDYDGSFSYSAIAYVKFSQVQHLAAWPNPTADGIIHLTSGQNEFNGDVLAVMDTQGRKIEGYAISQQSAGLQISLPTTLSAGMYLLVLQPETGESRTIPVIFRP